MASGATQFEHSKSAETGQPEELFTTERYLEKYLQAKYPSGNIELNLLRYEFITNFENYVRNVPLKASDPCTNNGTMKHLERLRKMVTWAVKNEWIDKDPFSNYKLNFKRTEREFLSREEMNLI